MSFLKFLKKSFSLPPTGNNNDTFPPEPQTTPVNHTDEIVSLKEKLKEEQDRSAAIISSMDEGLIILDKKGKIAAINPAAEKILEIKSAEALGKNFQDEIKLIIPATLTISPVQEKGSNGAVLILKDISREKLQSVEKKEQPVPEPSEKMAALEKARLAASISSIPMGFIITDMDRDIITINSAALYLLKIHEENLTFSQIADIFSPPINLLELNNKCIKTRQTIEVKELPFGHKFFHITLSPIHFPQDKSNECLGTVILIGDITERKVIERSKDEFFSIASHELRTPLTTLRGNTALIKNHYLDKLPDQELKDMLLDIHESAIRMIDIVNDFLDVSRLEQGKINFDKKRLDIGKIITEVLREFQVRSTEKKLYLRFEKPPEPIPEVLADPDRVKQILANLIANALKFTDQGGVTVEAKKEDNFVRIYVHDTGRGIPPEGVKLLFHKFQQTQENILTRDETPSTGLGLYISKLLVEGMNGAIRLETTDPGHGSVFSFTLPLSSTPGVEQLHT